MCGRRPPVKYCLHGQIEAGRPESRGFIVDIHDLANREADRIEADESLTDKEKARYLRDLAEELYEAEHEQDYQNEHH